MPILITFFSFSFETRLFCRFSNFSLFYNLILLSVYAFWYSKNLGNTNWEVLQVAKLIKPRLSRNLRLYLRIKTKTTFLTRAMKRFQKAEDLIFTWIFPTTLHSFFTVKLIPPRFIYHISAHRVTEKNGIPTMTPETLLLMNKGQIKDYWKQIQIY